MGGKNKQKRKSREKSSVKSDETDEGHTGRQEDPLAESTDQEDTPKKKKHKRKNKEVEHYEDQLSNQNQEEPQLVEDTAQEPLKRVYTDDDSDVEDKRKKKKKHKRKNKKAENDEEQLSNQNREDHQPEQDTELEPLILPQVHTDDDSDVEDKPKRKKKKKPIVPTDGTGPKKGAKSIRQMKREKHAERQAAAEAVHKDELKTECLNYLSQWKHNRQNWKFMKVKQGWLFRNKFSPSLVPDASWPTLLEYFESAQGNIRKLLLEDANKIIKQLDDWTESENNENKKDEDETEETKTEVTKPDDNVYKRARDLIQCLQE